MSSQSMKPILTLLVFALTNLGLSPQANAIQTLPGLPAWNCTNSYLHIEQRDGLFKAFSSDPEIPNYWLSVDNKIAFKTLTGIDFDQVYGFAAKFDTAKDCYHLATDKAIYTCRVGASGKYQIDFLGNHGEVLKTLEPSKDGIGFLDVGISTSLLTPGAAKLSFRIFMSSEPSRVNVVAKPLYTQDFRFEIGKDCR